MNEEPHPTDRERDDRPVEVTLHARPERHLLRPTGSHRHVDFHIQVGDAPPRRASDLAPLTLAFVLDRSGSMSGRKLETAKRAALAVIDRLQESDRFAVVVFDHQIDVLQPLAPASAAAKKELGQALAGIEARGQTALRQGWLTGCQEIAGDVPYTAERGIARCLLLTDGLANVGITDPEQIAGEAAGVREQTGISTSTFGLGADYNEGLLGPMAVAGGGQFHHLRTADEIATTFTGELRELMAVAVSNLRLEVVVDGDVEVEAVSAYWARRVPADDGLWAIAVGNLAAREERHAVLRFGFPPQNGRSEQIVRARLVWSGAGAEQSTTWQEVRFDYAGQEACDTEAKDLTVMHWAGLHESERARREAVLLSRQGDRQRAAERLRQVESQVASYAGDDRDLRVAMDELREIETEVSRNTLSPMAAKEVFFQSQRRSRGQRDLRGWADGDRDQADRLVRRYLHNQIPWPGGLAQPGPEERLCDLYRGCLLWGAVGDALGRAVEGWNPEEIRARHGPQGLRSYVPWRRWQSGPTGTITDDTELTIELAHSLLATNGRLDPEDFARRLVAWLPHGRGIGRTTREVLERMTRGEPWWQAAAAVNSAGNGAAMRAAPVGLAWALAPSPDNSRRDAILSAVLTHTHPIGVAGAVVIAAGVAFCLREAITQPGPFDQSAFLEFIGRSVEGVEPERTGERRRGGQAIRLGERIAELPEILKLAPEEAFQRTWNGGFALESVPAALYCFLHSPDDPRKVILTAVNGGHDADTVASMAGNLAGAWHGAARLRSAEPEWWAQLEYRDELSDLADGLLHIALQRWERA